MAVSSVTSRFLRPLNRIELPWAQIEASGCAPNGAIVVQLDGPLDERTLRAALDQLQLGHAALRVGIAADRRGRPHFVCREKSGGNAPVSLSVLPRDGADQAVHIVEDLLQRPFCADEPLMRVVALLGEHGGMHELIMSSQHCVEDLHSAIQRVDALLHLCRQIRFGRPVVTPPTLALPMLEAAALPAHVRGWRGRMGLARYTGRVLRHLTQERCLLVSRERIAPDELRTRLLLRELPAHAATALHERCAANRARPLGACYAAMLLAAARAYDAARLTLPCETLVDMRRELKGRMECDQSGCLVGTVATTHTVTPDTEFWTLARAVHADVTAAIRRGDHYHRLRLAEHIVPVLTRTGRRVTSALSLSYAGGCRISDASVPFKARSFWTAASIHGLGPACFSTVIPQNDRCVWSFSYVEPRLDRAWAEAFADEAVRCLLRALSIAPTP